MNKDDKEQTNSSSTNWERKAARGAKPLVKEFPSHKCQMITMSFKLSLASLCLFNYADTVTDLLVTVDMFRNRSYVLGCISLGILLQIGIVVPTFLGTGKELTWGRILAALTFSSSQYFAVSEILCHPKGKLFSRLVREKTVSKNESESPTEWLRQLLGQKINQKFICLTSIKSRLNDAIFYEKIPNRKPGPADSTDDTHI
jgi:hypothetical protein